MLDLIFVTLLQLAGGDPAPAPQGEAAASNTPSDEPALAGQTGAPAETAEPQSEHQASSADDPASRPAPESASDSSSDAVTVTASRVHCRYEETTGSHHRTRVCTTEVQDRAQDAATRRQLDNMLRDSIQQQTLEINRSGS